MTKDEFKEAVKLAETADLSEVDDSALHGLQAFGAPRDTVRVTIKAVAKMTHHLAMQLNGEWDSNELNNFADFCRRRVQIIG